MNEDRYYIEEYLREYRIHDRLIDRYDYIATCYDDVKASLILELLNESWNKAMKREAVP